MIMAAIGQVASISGSRTVRSGLRMAAVSAMNLTPQKTMTSASTRVACRLRPRESPVKSAMAWTASIW